MLIARLIADPVNWKTQLFAMQRELKPIHPVVAFPRLNLNLDTAFLLDTDVTVLELTSEHGDMQLAFNILEKHFPNSDILICKDEITIPKLFVSDMDSTMIEQECIDELADFAGLKEQISDITERAMQGELDFQDALKERVALLGGLEEEAIGRCLAERITPTPGAKVLNQTLKAYGCRSVLVTGGFHHFADAVGDWLGFDRVIGNRLGVEGGKLTGKLDGAICDANTKEQVLREEAGKLGTGARVLASGDGANDIPMLQAADYGFAYKAKPKARSAANGRVERGDLTSILALLGIDREHWVQE